LRAAGISAPPEVIEWTGTWVFHYGLGVGWGLIYPLLRRYTSWHPVTAGLSSGAAMSLLVDEALGPALGFTAPPLGYPLGAHLRGLAAHLVFGLAVAATVEVGRGVLTRLPAPRLS